MTFLRRLTAVVLAWWQALSAPRRIAYAAVTVLAGIVILASGAPVGVTCGLWLAANGLFLVWLALWGMLHPAAVVRSRNAVLGWALAVAVVLTLLLHAGFEQIVSQITEVWIPSGLLFFGAFLVLLPALFVAGTVIGLLGAALGDFLARRTAQGTAMARVGVTGFWLTLLIVFIAATALAKFEVSALLRAAVAGSFPLLSLWLAPLAQHLEEEQVSSLLHAWMKRHLVFRLPASRGVKTVDFRVFVFSLAGFLLTAVLSWSGLLGSLQPAVLLWMIRQHNGVVRLPWFGAETRPPAENFVLLTWDNVALERARERSSEPAVQEEVLRRLAACGVKRIIVSVPHLSTNADAWQEASDLEGDFVVGLDGELRNVPPRRTTAASGQDLERARWERSARDLPRMLDAARASGQAIIALQSRELGGLLMAGVGNPASGAWQALAGGLPVGTDRLPPYRVSSLPSVPLSWGTRTPPSVPWLVLDPKLRPGDSLDGLRRTDREAVLGDKRLPLIAPGVLLVDFRNASPGSDFARIPISAVVEDQKVASRNSQGGEVWIPASEFLKGKIVFLESAQPRHRATPVGELTRMETLVYATATVLGEGGMRRASTLVLGGWALFWSIVVGLTSSRRGLLGGSWRMAGAALVILLLSVSEFLNGVWLDPIFPLVSASSSLLLVTQLSFALERRAKDHTRALLRRFVAPEFVEELLEDPDQKLGLGGRRERVVVLFADVRGFTAFAEQHSPEEVVKVVNAYLHVMTDALHHYGGLLDKYTGDGLMALFRIARDETEAVARAVSAALAMRDAVLALSADRMAGGARSLQVGIALHVGEAVVGLVGNPVRQINYTALGHAVVIAARLQGLALGGEVVVSHDVRIALGSVFELEAREPVQVKGVSQPVLCYAVKRDLRMLDWK